MTPLRPFITFFLFALLLALGAAQATIPGSNELALAAVHGRQLGLIKHHPVANAVKAIWNVHKTLQKNRQDRRKKRWAPRKHL